MIFARRPATPLVAMLAAGILAACGDDSEEPAAPESTVDAQAFEDCIFSGSLDIGIYEEVKDVDPALSEAAEDAEFFEAGKGDDGIVAFYVFDDAEAAEAFAPEFEPTLDDFTQELTQGAGVDPVTPSVETEGAIALGLIPFSPDKEAELANETLADVSNCAGEAEGP